MYISSSPLPHLDAFIAVSIILTKALPAQVHKDHALYICLSLPHQTILHECGHFLPGDEPVAVDVIDLEAVLRLLLLRTYEEYHGTKQWHCISLNSAIMITFQEYIKAQYPLFPVKS